MCDASELWVGMSFDIDMLVWYDIVENIWYRYLFIDISHNTRVIYKEKDSGLNI